MSYRYEFVHSSLVYFPDFLHSLCLWLALVFIALFLVNRSAVFRDFDNIELDRMTHNIELHRMTHNIELQRKTGDGELYNCVVATLQDNIAAVIFNY